MEKKRLSNRNSFTKRDESEIIKQSLFPFSEVLLRLQELKELLDFCAKVPSTVTAIKCVADVKVATQFP